MVRSISKNRIVRNLFTKLAPLFDAFEPLQTLSLGRRWRRKMVEYSRLQKPQRILDACTGTGQSAIELANAYGAHCHVVAVDFCPAMVSVAKQRLRATHFQRRVEFKIENVEIMPFPDAFFDGVFVAFGMRFVSDIRTVLRECHRVLKPGAPLVVLEIANPRNPLRPLTHLYREYFTPAWAGLRHKIPTAITHYLYDSLVHYPDADKLGRMLLRAGFDNVNYRSLSLGIATLHRGFKTEEKNLQPPLFLTPETESESDAESESQTEPESEPESESPLS